MFRVWNRAPAAYLLDPVYRIDAQGHDADEVLHRFGLTRDALHDAGQYVSADQFYGVIEAFIVDLAVPEVGFAQPESLQLLNTGMAGLAAMTAADLGSAMAFTMEYQDLLAVPVQVDQAVRGDGCHVIFGDVVGFEGPEPDWLRPWAVETTLSALVLQLQAMHVSPVEVRIDYSRPTHANIYEETCSCPLIFEADICELVFPERALAFPQATANPLAHAIARRQCEESIRKSVNQYDLVERIEGLVLSSTGAVPTIGEMAVGLGLSQRTLQRRLNSAGTSYREVVARTRHRLACELLSGTTMPVKEIAYLTGYTEVANFSAAFKILAGHSPMAYRMKS